jgi:hypothetical protein
MTICSLVSRIRSKVTKNVTTVEKLPHISLIKLRCSDPAKGLSHKRILDILMMRLKSGGALRVRFSGVIWPSSRNCYVRARIRCCMAKMDRSQTRQAMARTEEGRKPSRTISSTLPKPKAKSMKSCQRQIGTSC